jgi:hypothetical protein
VAEERGYPEPPHDHQRRPPRQVWTKATDQIAVTNSFKSAMQKAGHIFDASFLPPAERKTD